MKYELETVVTVEATEITSVGELPNRKQLKEWKEHVAKKVSDCIENIIGDKKYTANIKVKVFIHEKERAN